MRIIRYVMAAAALKLFFTFPQTKGLYRHIRNVFLSKHPLVKKWLPKFYVNRAKLFLELVKKYDAIQNGDRLLEIGTGWGQFESTFIRLFYDVNITLFDIWDWRQMKIFKRYFAEFAEVIDKEIDIAPTQYERVHSLLRAISSVSSFDELYHLLGFQYVIEPSGTLHHFPDESFNAIYSFAVLEHVKKDILSEYIQDLYRLLKPGGYSINFIDLRDHLFYADPSVCKKNYLKYSDKVWKRYFENEAQYINRVQRPEWLNLFHTSGLELVKEVSLHYNVDTIKIDKRYDNLDRQDLECILLRVVHRKPK